MPKLTKPGISDLHWQVTTIRHTNDIAVAFFETEIDAVEHAGIALAMPRASVYVSQVMHHGEHLRALSGGGRMRDEMMRVAERQPRRVCPVCNDGACETKSKRCGR